MRMFFAKEGCDFKVDEVVKTLDWFRYDGCIDTLAAKFLEVHEKDLMRPDSE